MDDNDITAIVGWPTEPEMVRFRAVASAAAAAAIARCCAILIRPVVGGPVERQARPRAWHMSGTSLLELATLDPAHEPERAPYGWKPLYDQAALDAAVADALERRREYDDALVAAERVRSQIAALAWGETHEPHVTVNARNAARQIAYAIRGA